VAYGRPVGGRRQGRAAHPPGTRAAGGKWAPQADAD